MEQIRKDRNEWKRDETDLEIIRSLHMSLFLSAVEMRNMKSLKSRRCTISGTTALQPGSLLLQVRLIRGLRLAMTLKTQKTEMILHN